MMKQVNHLKVQSNRNLQMDKRFRKIEKIKFDTPVYKNAPHEEADLLLVGFNSTRGAIEEAMDRLEKDGMKVNHAHIRLIHPFPTDEAITTCSKMQKK